MSLEQFLVAVIVAAFDYSHHVRPRAIVPSLMHHAMHADAFARGRL